MGCSSTATFLRTAQLIDWMLHNVLWPLFTRDRQVVSKVLLWLLNFVNIHHHLLQESDGIKRCCSLISTTSLPSTLPGFALVHRSLPATSSKLRTFLSRAMTRAGPFTNTPRTSLRRDLSHHCSYRPFVMFLSALKRA